MGKQPIITHGDVQGALERARIPLNKPLEQRNRILLRPCDGATNFAELPSDLVLHAFEEITRKIEMAQAGIAAFTDCERVLYMLFCNHGRYGV